MQDFSSNTIIIKFKFDPFPNVPTNSHLCWSEETCWLFDLILLYKDKDRSSNNMSYGEVHYPVNRFAIRYWNAPQKCCSKKLSWRLAFCYRFVVKVARKAWLERTTAGECGVYSIWSAWQKWYQLKGNWSCHKAVPKKHRQRWCIIFCVSWLTRNISYQRFSTHEEHLQN